MTKIMLTGGDASTPREAAHRILLILGCTDPSGAVFQDDVDAITNIISDLVNPSRRAEQLLRAYVDGEISLARLRECTRSWSAGNDFVLPAEVDC